MQQTHELSVQIWQSPDHTPDILSEARRELYSIRFDNESTNARMGQGQITTTLLQLSGRTATSMDSGNRRRKD